VVVVEDGGFRVSLIENEEGCVKRFVMLPRRLLVNNFFQLRSGTSNKHSFFCDCKYPGALEC
jgi:hypothetical protein